MGRSWTVRSKLLKIVLPLLVKATEPFDNYIPGREIFSFFSYNAYQGLLQAYPLRKSFFSEQPFLTCSLVPSRVASTSETEKAWPLLLNIITVPVQISGASCQRDLN
ncbi:hypothetical protein WAI453_009121 [Rhynchosporium graminicola]